MLGSSSFSETEGSQSSGSDTGSNAHRRLPGGEDYEADFKICNELSNDPDNQDPYFINDLREYCESRHIIGKNIFPHQLWLHRGSLLKFGVPLHPSEYGESIGRLSTVKDIKSRREEEDEEKFTLEEIMAAPIWQYVEIIEEGKKSYWPQMISKQTADLQTPVHWTLEKYTPTFQGEDFFVNIKLGDKEPDLSIDQKPPHEIVDSIGWGDHYKPLMYNLESDRIPADVTGQPTWFDGISNEA